MSRERPVRRKGEAEAGNILFTALLLLLVMNLLGIGLVQSAMKENKAAGRKQVDSLTFQASESCLHDAVAWLKSQSRPSTSLPYTIAQDNLNSFLTADDPKSVRDRLNGYKYSCTITSLISKSVTGQDDGQGERVNTMDGYGAGGDLSPRYYYQVVALGEGPNTTTKRITALVSISY